MKERISLAQRLRHLPIARFTRFGIVGFSGLFVDMAVVAVLVSGFGLHEFYGSAISIEVAIINNFLWNDAWTFADVAQQQKGWKARFRRFYQFNSVCLMGAALQLGITRLLLWVPFVQALPALMSQVTTSSLVEHADFYLAKFVAIVLVTLWNFWINLKLSWRN